MVHRHANVHSLECTYITLLPSGFELRAYDDCIVGLRRLCRHNFGHNGH